MTPNKPFIVTVSQLNRKISLMLKNERTFSGLSIRGEISNLTIHYKSGHIYFSLKDEASSIKAVMFRSNAERLSFVPENGMSVIVTGDIQCFERDGIYQIYVSSIVPDGIGEQAIAFRQLKEKLENEGLFLQKRALPKFPKKICVVTAETGAALQDILNILGRRYPSVKVVIVPILVQGEYAPESICKGLRTANETDSDIIIFGRGGGSAEDLSAFNSESVARTVFASSIPTISAVGHETDFSISDFVADLRAPTPSAAAELSVPDKQTLIDALDTSLSQLETQLFSLIKNKERAVEDIHSAIRSKHPGQQLIIREQLLDAIWKDISFNADKAIKNKEYLLSERSSVLSALNPINVLMRGYSIITKENSVITSVSEADKDDIINIRLYDGEITAQVSKIVKFGKENQQ